MCDQGRSYSAGVVGPLLLFEAKTSDWTQHTMVATILAGLVLACTTRRQPAPPDISLLATQVHAGAVTQSALLHLLTRCYVRTHQHWLASIAL